MVRTNLTSLHFTGLFYVIDGILDISLPLYEHKVEKTSASEKEETSQTHTSPSTSSSSSLNGKPQPARRESVSGGERSHPTSPGRKSRHLFTVKPGGIAGYMGRCTSYSFFQSSESKSLALASLCNVPSTVDITAKMDTYVGFLPYSALERLLEKQPIVLLTLAKRLISLLSPLGRLNIRQLRR